MTKRTQLDILFATAAKAPRIASGAAFPHNACTTFVLSNHNAGAVTGLKQPADKTLMFFNTHGKAFIFENAKDFEQRFKPVYKGDEPTSADGEWSIYFSNHAHDEDVIHHIALGNRLPNSAVLDIARMIASSDFTVNQVGRLFHKYTHEEDRDMIDVQVGRLKKAAVPTGPNPHHIGS